jgi:hypothetical protein
MKMNARLLLAALGIALAAVAVAPAAQTTDHNMRVNEIYPAGPGEAFVELLDVAPGGEDPPQESYAVSSYDSSGAQVASETFGPPYPFASRTTPFVLGDGGDAPALPLAAGAGKVCFEVPGLSDPLHCLTYDSVPAGQSVQRQPCGRTGTAAPTRGQENALVASACAGRLPCDDPRLQENVRPKLIVSGKKTQHVDRFALRFTLNEDGDISVRGSAWVGRLGHRGVRPGPKTIIWGPINRDLKAGVPVRIKFPMTARFRRAVRRGARRGEETRVSITTLGRDINCFRNKTYSARAYYLTP